MCGAIGKREEVHNLYTSRVECVGRIYSHSRWFHCVINRGYAFASGDVVVGWITSMGKVSAASIPPPLRVSNVRLKKEQLTPVPTTVVLRRTALVSGGGVEGIVPRSVSIKRALTSSRRDACHAAADVTADPLSNRSRGGRYGVGVNDAAEREREERGSKRRTRSTGWRGSGGVDRRRDCW